MSDHSFRIMTYNTHHGSGNIGQRNVDTESAGCPGADCSLDLPRIANVIRAEHVDIVALQEVDRFWDRSAGIDQPAVYANLLNMEFRYGANLLHDPDEHAGVLHEFGVATLSRYPIISSENYLLPTTEGWEQRGMLDTRINVPGIGEVAVLNTHLQSNANGEPKEAAKQRMNQATVIAEHVANLEVPVIVLGDLNTEINSGEIDALVGSDSSLTDAWENAGKGAGETIFDGAHGEPTARIDYILVSHHFHVVSAAVIDNEVARMSSDHFPLVAELTFIAPKRPS